MNEEFIKLSPQELKQRLQEMSPQEIEQHLQEMEQRDPYFKLIRQSERHMQKRLDQLERHMNERLDQLRRHTNERLDQLVTRLLQPEKKHRPESSELERGTGTL